MDKRALIVGVNYYVDFNNLNSCVADANSINELLSRDAAGRVNYTSKLLISEDSENMQVTRSNLRRECRELFEHDGDVILYFSGHGIFSDNGGYLATSDAVTDDYGISMHEIIQMANSSRAQNSLILLDTCHSGAMGNRSEYSMSNILENLRENTTIIAASEDRESAIEAGGHGLFTASLIDALDGGAADHMGWVTAPSIYAYVERRFDALAQRPVYKSHVNRLAVVRHCAPIIEHELLMQITTYFPTQDYAYGLDPEHEPEDEHGNLHEPVNQEKVQIAKLFKQYRDAGLLRAKEDGEQLFWTARYSHNVELTLRGKEYWRLVKYNRI
jgi:hypothetical protein